MYQPTLAEICERYVRQHPGLTAGEIGDQTGLGHDKVWRRLSELKNRGIVVQGPTRRWRGKPQMTWWPSDMQPPAQQPPLL
jgi:DNA-binding IclR family transcriptional regulator